MSEHVLMIAEDVRKASIINSFMLIPDFSALKLWQQAEIHAKI